MNELEGKLVSGKKLWKCIFWGLHIINLSLKWYGVQLVNRWPNINSSKSPGNSNLIEIKIACVCVRLGLGKQVIAMKSRTILTWQN